MEETTMKFKYNYVIIGAGNLYYPVGYHDVMAMPNVCYLTEDDLGLSIWARRLTISEKLPRFVRNTMCWLAFPRMFRHKFSRQEPICYVVFADKHDVFDTLYFKYLDMRYKHVKKVLYIQDLVARNKRLDIDVVRRKFDVLLSYDKMDCVQYGIVYQQTPYSVYSITEDNTVPCSDVFFCGLAKDAERYKSILKCYDECMAQGLRCQFFVSGVDDIMERREGIIYNQRLAYDQILQHVAHTKCIVEIMQKEAVGYTPRTWESIIYDKHLLTNNTSLADAPFFEPESMHIMKEDLCSIADWINTPVYNSEEKKQALSPIRLLEKLETIFDNGGDE